MRQPAVSYPRYRPSIVKPFLFPDRHICRDEFRRTGPCPLPNPRKRDFFVYTFCVGGYPFYIGIGRDRRASDRIRYVRSLPKPMLRRKSLSVRVIAALDKKVSIRYSRTRKSLDRCEALALEKRMIACLIRKGYRLTNWQHNPLRHNNTQKAVRAILRGVRRQS